MDFHVGFRAEGGDETMEKQADWWFHSNFSVYLLFYGVTYQQGKTLSTKY